MKHYLLSVDPSLKDTGFVLWENNCIGDKNGKCKLSTCWKPIWVNNYNFKKYYEGNFIEEIAEPIIKYISYGYKSQYGSYHLEEIPIVIERGIYNPKFGRGKETLDILRGLISGLFFQFIQPNKMISPKAWQNWYLKNWHDYYGKNSVYANINKWDKTVSCLLANSLIKLYDWNIDIKDNHNIADALLIVWYVNNKEKKYEATKK